MTGSVLAAILRGSPNGASAPQGSHLRMTAGLWLTHSSKQRRDLPYLQRPEKYHAVDEAQWKRPRLLAFQHRFGAERVDARGDADAGVLLDDLAKPRDRAVERAEQAVDVLGLDPGRDAIERCLRHAILQHLLDAERRNHFLDPRHRHLQFAFDAPIGVEAER